MFKKRGLWQFYQPLRSGGVKQRSAETTDAPLARKMERLVRRLADDHRWAVLETIGTTVHDRRITVPILYALSQQDPDLTQYEAVDTEADVVVIDHIDHVQGGGGSQPFQEGVKVIQKLHDLKQSLELPYLVRRDEPPTRHVDGRSASVRPPPNVRCN
jgi:hypothetical protein